MIPKVRGLATLAAFTLLCAASLGLSAGKALAQEVFQCPTAPQPVFSLDITSRYKGESNDRNQLDADASAKVDEELGPIDGFLSDLAVMANKVHLADGDRKAIADCVIAQIAVWAESGALADLQSRTSKLTIGSRISAFSIVLQQVMPHGGSGREIGAIEHWLRDLMERQMLFWEEDAPDGAKQGNLRAWAALAGAAASDVLGDPVIRSWAAWSARYVLCKAEDDGSLPQEMRRGRFAYHYQMHSVAPLVTTAAILKKHGIDLDDACEGALGRAVNFVVDDLKDGEATRAITGEVQTYFDGTREISGFNLAWLEAYLAMDFDVRLNALAESYRPLSHSKLGGDQTLIWGR